MKTYKFKCMCTFLDFSSLRQSSKLKETVQEEATSEVKTPSQKATTHSGGSSRSKKQAQKDMNNERNNKPEVPDCDCFSNDKKPPEPGSYYTHLGTQI